MIQTLTGLAQGICVYSNLHKAARYAHSRRPAVMLKAHCHWTGFSCSTRLSLHRNKVLRVPLKQLWHSYSYAADQQEQKEPDHQA